MFAARLGQYRSDAQAMALKQMTQIAHRQAAVMGYGDAFLILTLVLSRPHRAGAAAEETRGAVGRRWRRALKPQTWHPSIANHARRGYKCYTL